MRQTKLTQDDLINVWLKDYFDTTLEEEYAKQPWTDSREFYARYRVTQAQHDEWNAKAKEMFKKALRLNKYSADRFWGLTYLNTSPSVKDEQE